MASTRGHNIATGKLFSTSTILVIIASVVCCQSALESGNSSAVVAVVDPSQKLNDTSLSGTILGASEFVDFTESPTLLFDGTSNDNNDTIESSSLPAPTASTQAPITTTITTTTTTTNSELSTNRTASEDADTKTTPTTVSSSDEEGDEEQPTEAPTKEPFEPPQNVSQYMDYIETLFHDLRHQISDLFEPHLPQLIRSSQMVQLSGSCSYDMLRMALALRQFEPWALRMIDSSGKVPEGIFEGSFTALGSYDECLNTVFGQSDSAGAASQSQNQSQNQSQTQGKYCLVNVSPYLPPKPPADRVERMFQEEANRRNYTKDNQFSRLSPMFYYMKFRIGVCIPSTCSESDMDSLSEALSSSLRLNITIPNCRIRQYQPITNHQLVGGLVFASVLALVFGATLMDYSRGKFDRQKRQVVLSVASLAAANTEVAPRVHNQQLNQSTRLDKEVVVGSHWQEKFLNRLSKHWSWLSFSLFTNYRLYFSSPSNRHHSTGDIGRKSTTNAQIVRCLNGIRVISLCWVIVANSYITLDPRATKRLTKTREAPKDFFFQMVAQASLAIETFFFLSGVLMSLSFARKLWPEVGVVSVGASDKLQEETDRRRNRWRWLQFYVHRYVRMTPATMLVIAVSMYAYNYGDGPLWFEATHKAHQSCSENWWRHLLHVANFIDSRQMCFIHYWYIAADMQLFLFAPLLLYLIYRYRKVGYALVTLIGAASIGSIFYTTYMHNLPPTLLFYNSDPESRREFGNTIMTKPLTHALPYLVGMLVGKWLTGVVANKSSGTEPMNVDSNGRRSLTGLFGGIATVVALAEVFLPYKWNNSHLPTRLLASLYAAFFRFAWSLVLAYIIMSCRHKRSRRCAAKLPPPPPPPPVNDQTYGGDFINLANPISGSSSSSSSGSQCASCQSLDNIINGSSTSVGRQRVAAANGKYDDNIIMSSCVTLVGGTKSKLTEQEAEWCMCGSGGNLVNRLLSLDVFTLLSKLSFVAYLIHLPLMSVFIAQTRGLFAFSHTLVIHLALSYLVMTFLLSFLLVHLIELPFLTFERYLFDKCLLRKPAAAKTSHDHYIGEPTKTFTGGSSSSYTINSSAKIMMSTEKL